MGKAIRRIIFFVALIVFIGSAGYLAQHYFKGKAEQNDFESLKVDGKYDVAQLHEKNGDIVGWLTIEGTKVDYPVMQTKEKPEYYLRRNFKKEDTMAGTPFMDATSDMETPSANWMIYGHNMKNGTMFHDTLDYEDKDFYEKHKTFTFETLTEKGTYEVVAAYYTEIYTEDSKKFKYYQYPNIINEIQYNDFIQGSKSLCPYDTGVTPVYPEQLITLSTCAYHVEDGRFVVVGRKISSEPTQTEVPEETPQE